MSAGPDREHPHVARVRAALCEAGAPGAAARMRVLPTAAPTAAAAADALGVEVGAIVNSLVFVGNGAPLLVLTSGAHRVDTEFLGAAVGLTIRRADADAVRAATGQPIGGVAPLGHPAPLRTLLDRALQSFDTVWAAGGIPHALFSTTFDELLAVTGAQVVSVTAGD